MGLRLFLRADGHRAERDLSVDLVQETRLDLRAATALVLAVALEAGAASLAQAQPLVPNPGLTTLMQPQRLDRSRPLVSEDRAAGTRSGLRQGVTPCDRAGAASPGGGAAAPTGPSLYGGGSGPGGYGQYIPGAPPPTDPSGNKQSAATDRPLYGGTGRPLWDTGARRPGAASAATKPAPTTTGSSGEPGKDPASAAPAPPSTIPAPVRDRPLWAESGLSFPLAPAAAAPGPGSDSAPASSASAAGGIAAAPCTAAAPR